MLVNKVVTNQLLQFVKQNSNSDILALANFTIAHKVLIKCTKEGIVIVILNDPPS